MCAGVSLKNLPGAVGDLHTDAIALLAPTLGGGVITGSCPTQTGPRAASIIVTTCGPAWPGAKAPIDSHIADLLATKWPKNKAFNGFSQKAFFALDWCSQGCVALGNAAHGYYDGCRNQFSSNRCKTTALHHLQHIQNCALTRTEMCCKHGEDMMRFPNSKRDSERQINAANGHIQRMEIWGNKSGSINRYLRQNRMKQEGSNITGAINYEWCPGHTS